MSTEQMVQVPLVRWSPQQPSDAVTHFLSRSAFVEEAEEVAAGVLADIKTRGDKAVVKYVKQYDKAALRADQLPVTQEERVAAREGVDHEFKRAAEESYKRIVKFSEAGMRKDWTIQTPKGGVVGEQFSPLDRVGAYVPGGEAPLVSTALMTVALAKVAGVPEIVACTPADRDGGVNPYILYALDLAGVTEIYRIGGIQAIGAMAYGTESIRKVQKIVGPGGPYVTAAKRLVYGEVALDLVAGPSEIAILADDSAPASYVAADLLSQAEHGTGHEKALLVTNSQKLAEAVQAELMLQAEQLPRRAAVTSVLNRGALLVVTDTLDAGMDLCNDFAPEHFELLVQEPRKWLRKARRAGAVFAGPWTPECVGDFMAGPSHVLPTGGKAAMFSGLTVDDFRRRTSVVSYTRADLQDVVGGIEAFGRVEDLEAHTRSARIRFE